MVKKIEFAANPDFFLDIPKPGKRHIPDWYKESEKIIGGVPHVAGFGSLGQPTIKSCGPFLDSYLTGYIVELWQDIEVVKINDDISIVWDAQPNVLTTRENKFAQQLPVPDEYSKQHFAWTFPYAYKTPPGYSVLVTQPFNRLDLPFMTMTGVVDADEGIHGGNLPVFFKRDFQGIIKQGTPIAQMIPFKREAWEAEENLELVKLAAKYESLSNRVVSGWYKKNIWKKKDFI